MSPKASWCRCARITQNPLLERHLRASRCLTGLSLASAQLLGAVVSKAGGPGLETKRVRRRQIAHVIEISTITAPS